MMRSSISPLAIGRTVPSSRLFQIATRFADAANRNGLGVLDPLAAMRSHVCETDEPLYYDVDGGGFSSIVDVDGNDWISWNSSAGSAGQFRGVPNLVYPEGYMHPGYGGVTSTLVSAGPLEATIRSVSANEMTVCAMRSRSAICTMRCP